MRHSDAVRNVREAECSSAEGTVAQQAQLHGGGLDSLGVILVFLGNWRWSSVFLVRELFFIRSDETLRRNPGS